MCHNLWDVAQQVILRHPQTAVCGGDLVNVTCPRSPSLVQISLLILRSNIDNTLILKVLDTWARKGFGVQWHSVRQLPSFKPHMGKKDASRYTVTHLAGTQYYIPSIGNGDAASAARATDQLCIWTAQPTLPLCGSMLVYPLTCVELARAYEEAQSQHSTERQHIC